VPIVTHHVIAGLAIATAIADPAIHQMDRFHRWMDARVKPAHDEFRVAGSA
jgi:hypothetical protein